MDQQIAVLIDFDNYFKRELSNYQDEEFNLAITDIVKKSLDTSPEATEVKIRIYGGWYRNELFSSKASLLQQMLSRISIFPIIKNEKRIRGKVELATSLYDFPSHIWTNTFKEKPGLPRLRINHETITQKCEETKSSCPAYILNKFTSKKTRVCSIDACVIKNSDVFIKIEQKMVDTLMSCDIMSFSKDPRTSSVCLFSDDLDLLPPLGYSSLMKLERNANLNIYLFIKNDWLLDLCKQLLQPFDVKILWHE